MTCPDFQQIFEFISEIVEFLVDLVPTLNRPPNIQDIVKKVKTSHVMEKLAIVQREIKEQMGETVCEGDMTFKVTKKGNGVVALLQTSNGETILTITIDKQFHIFANEEGLDFTTDGNNIRAIQEDRDENIVGFSLERPVVEGGIYTKTTSGFKLRDGVRYRGTQREIVGRGLPQAAVCAALPAARVFQSKLKTFLTKTIHHLKSLQIRKKLVPFLTQLKAVIKRQVLPLVQAFEKSLPPGGDGKCGQMSVNLINETFMVNLQVTQGTSKFRFRHLPNGILTTSFGPFTLQFDSGTLKYITIFTSAPHGLKYGFKYGDINGDNIIISIGFFKEKQSTFHLFEGWQWERGTWKQIQLGQQHKPHKQRTSASVRRPPQMPRPRARTAPSRSRNLDSEPLLSEEFRTLLERQKPGAMGRKLVKYLHNVRWSKSEHKNRWRQLFNKVNQRIPVFYSKLTPDDVRFIVKQFDTIYFQDMIHGTMKEFGIRIRYLLQDIPKSHTAGYVSGSKLRYDFSLCPVVIYQMFQQPDKEKYFLTNGKVSCYNSLDCLLRIASHELIHVLQSLTGINEDNINKGHGPWFKRMARRFFGLLSISHDLMTPKLKSENQDTFRGLRAGELPKTYDILMFEDEQGNKHSGFFKTQKGSKLIVKDSRSKEKFAVDPDTIVIVGEHK